MIEIKNNNWSLWDHIESSGIENDIGDQKMIIDEVLKQEDRLLSQVRNKRKSKSLNSKELINTPYGKLAILMWVIIVLSIIGIYALK
jgi:hypothetical protein